MTTLYKPVLIETAEQADSLHVGTIAYQGRRENPHAVAVKALDPTARTHALWAVEGVYVRSPEVAGWTALVPIKAEEETHSIQTRGQTTPEWRTRLVTPWEEA